MPIQTLILPDGSRVEKVKPHNPIYYEGTINKEGTSIEGTWKIKKSFGFIDRRFYFSPQTKGVWMMGKE